MIDSLIQDGCGISNLQKEIEQAEVFIVDNVAKYFHEEMELSSTWWSGDFPNCAPPYGAFWMEARAPQLSVYKGKITPLTVHAWGALFLASDLYAVSPEDRQRAYQMFKQVFSLEQYAEAKWWVTVIPFVQPFMNADSLGHLNVQGHFLIKANGEMLICEYREGTEEFARVSAQEGTAVKRDAQGAYVGADSQWGLLDDNLPPSLETFQSRVLAAHEFLYPFWLAISFLHCKNVTTAQVDPCHPQGKKKASMQCQRMHYHTLNIHPMREVLRREGKQESTGLKQALHICRGHFRDYSKGSGLFGKHKGLYWFDQHLRGSSKYGEVVKDYAIHPQ
jgi:hypothetical protein